MSRPIVARIDAAALQHNLAQVRAQAPGAQVLAVVKANAYGHGLERVASLLGDADGMGLLDVESARQLRAGGFAGVLLLLEGVFSAAEWQTCAELGLHAVVHSPEQLVWLEAASLARPVGVFLKINSGMNRLGFRPEQAAQLHAQLSRLPQVSEVVLMTHFACADEPAVGVQAQLAVFDAACAGLPVRRSLANSAAIFAAPSAHADWVRPGLVLYGASPFAGRSAAELGLRAVMSLHSELISVQQVHAGDAVGYGARFVAERDMRVGVVACGYADGYPRHAPTGTPVLVDGVRTRLLGRVSMDMLAVDVSDIAQARVGSPVELWGKQLPIDEVAAAASTISYELMCAVAPRVPVQVAP